ncbi:hypothetical protein ML5_0864 [Micromonospora sp. L5]|uniref:hypothetical protein n=1 Tax=Micromonospora sp. (strain L5) TaxID=648999 RepID=UPI0001C45C90|nr:hypothetical protein [Micromonospora sp. L5]ADU06406.1 hypothetical protein ML5_0864 [Micromonospora sp. L5]
MSRTLAQYRADKENTPQGKYSPAQWKEFDALERKAEEHYRTAGQKLIAGRRQSINHAVEELAAQAENIRNAWGVLQDRARQGRIGAAAFREASRKLIEQRQGIPAEVERLREEAAGLVGLDPIAEAERMYDRLPAMAHSRPFLPNL